MNTISLTVENRRITASQSVPIVAGNVDADKVTASFSGSEWSGLDITVTFSGGGAEIEQEFDGDNGNKIPWECLRSAGDLHIAFAGYDNGTMVIRTERMDVPLSVSSHGPIDGTEDTPATRSIVAKCMDATQGAENVNATMSGTSLTVTDRTGASVTVDCKGAKGDTGDTGPQGEPGEDGSIVSVSATGTATDEVRYITIDGVEKKLAGGGGGTSDFDALTNRPKYNGAAMTHATEIPEVKSATWDGKQDAIADLATIRSGAAAGSTAYQKPASGIPSADMASAVQSSLTKADSALQEHQSLAGYATQTWVGQQGYLTQHQSLAAYRTAAQQDAIHDATKQDVSNLVTSVSSASTDAQYPSAKCLHDMCGNIEALLEAML